jgi:beta-lactamase regulating signal transducer with metallopeptidase domain
MHWVFENTLIAAVLALVVVLVSRAARLAPVIRHGLWLVVLIKLITPPLISIGPRIPTIWSPSAGRGERVEHSIRGAESTRTDVRPDDREPDAESVADDQPSMAIDLAATTGDVSDDNFRDAVEAVDIPNDRVLADRPPGRATELVEDSGSLLLREEMPRREVNQGWEVGRIAIGIFLTGMCLAVLIQSLRLARLRRLLARATAAPDELVRLVGELSSCLGIRPPAVRLSHEIHSPIICALGRAVLIWPASGHASLRGSALRSVVVHELAHVARRDHWIGWLEFVAGCAWWWNPLFWHVRRQLRENAELACDAWATGIVPEGKRDYARALVDLAELDLQQIAAVPALGVGDGSRQLFERRLVMILGNRVRYQMGMVGLVGIGLLGLTALVGCSDSFAGDETSPVNADKALDVPAATNLLPEATALPLDFESAPPAPAAGPTPIALDQSFPTPKEALPPSNEDRLKRLEDRFDALINELHALRSNSAPDMAPEPKAGQRDSNWKRQTGVAASPPRGASGPPGANPFGTVTENADGSKKRKSDDPVPFEHTTKEKKPKWTADAVADLSADSNAVTLTRVTYKLPAGKAVEIGQFLASQLSDEVEIRVKDASSLQITATNDEQAAISPFIRLLQAQAAKTSKREPNVGRRKIDVRSRTLPETPKSETDADADPSVQPPTIDLPLREKGAPRSDDNLPAGTPGPRKH